MAERRRTRLTKSALRALQSAREAARRASRSSITPPIDLSRVDASTPAMPPVERLTPQSGTQVPPQSTSAEERAVVRMQSTPPRPRRGERRGDRRAAVGGGGSRGGATPGAPLTSDEAELVELIDRLAVVADGSGLAEIEIAAGGTRVVVRSRAALAASGLVVAASGASPAPPAAPLAPQVPPEGSAAPKAPAAAPTPSSASATFVNAPLTGVFYAARTPGAEPLVAVGQSVAVGQPIGLIEAMKLFNEIKSDRAGRVVRIFAENGRLVKAKAPLIEVEPT